MSKQFGKIALLQGGVSNERDVSLASAAMVGRELENICTEVIRFDTAERSLTELVELHVDAAFILLHGAAGEDGRMQAALEMLGIPYTGSRPQACALAMDKNLSKLIWAETALPTPPWLLVKDAAAETLDEIQLMLGYEVFVKPNHGGSSIYMGKVTKRSQLAAAIETALQEEDSVLIEQTVPGIELTYGIVEDTVFHGIQIETDQEFYDYAAKYELDTTQYICPPRIQADIEEHCRELALAAFQALGCSDWGRVDLMLRGREPFLLEANTVPGMTDHSLVPKAAAQFGLAPGELLTKILRQAR